MGSPTSERGRDASEVLRETTLSQGFWLLETPTTQGMWRAALGENPSVFSTTGARAGRVRGRNVDDFPVENVSWNDCVRYVAALNESGAAPEGWWFRLPSEAQWERACRAGGDGPTLDESGYWGENSAGRPHRVGEKAANAWGFRDMLGNVWECCSDRFGVPTPGPAVDPEGPSRGTARTAKGGGWRSSASYCRPASRIGVDPAGRAEYNGMRLAMVRAAETVADDAKTPLWAGVGALFRR